MARHRNPRHQQEVSLWAQELMKRDNFYVLDTETTGIGKGDEIVLRDVRHHGEGVPDPLIYRVVAGPVVPHVDQFGVNLVCRNGTA